MGATGQLLFDEVPPHQPLDAAQATSLCADIEAELSPQAQRVFAAHAAFFGWLVEGSPFLARLLRRHGEVLDALCEQSVADYVVECLAALEADMGTCDNRDAAMSKMRQARNRLALAIALADLADHWDVEAVTQALTRLADTSVACGLDFLLREAVRDEKLSEFSAAGLVVLALGKHGGQELNYSSDIDFVVYYTPDALPLADGLDERKFHITLVRDLTAMLQNMTADGFVFRVDLRLRPDPGATPVTISVNAALGYYESMGQNWERAVYIKARPIAGDLQAGQKFVDDLQPYIWRRYFDFAAVEDVHSMKRQIHAVRGHAEIAAMGHNLKLGRGGIREIEFFVQTQQLIAGGRDETLRGRRTVDMLAMLAQRGWIDETTAQRLTASYYYLRRMEHRLQMRLDEQTQTLPADEESFTKFARFAGYLTGDDFARELTAHLQLVTQDYALLFEQAESLSGDGGNLVFTGGEDDPETLETLATMGFQRPSLISATIRGWHAGRMGATRSARAREILTRLQPLIVTRLARSGDADEAFIQFDKFLTALPAGVQLFSLFQSNPHVLNLLIDIVSVAPRLAALLAGNAGLLEALVQPVSGALPMPELPYDDFEASMNIVRRHVHEEQFRIGTRILADPSMAMAHAAYTPLAEAAIDGLLQAARQDIERAHGALPEAQFCVLGMGKLGSGELALQSDLDLILICDAPDFSKLSDGEKPLDAEKWLARLARRLLSGLSAPTAEGGLYEVDTRLRPSGNAGPLVTKLSAFIDYQQSRAWTWEHMALTRARVIGGDAALGAKIEHHIATVLQQPRDLKKLVQDVQEMRARLRQHQPQAGPFDIRRGDGGLVDIEFIAQTLQLAHMNAHSDLIGPRSLPDSVAALAGYEILGSDDYAALSAAAQCFLSLRQIASLCLEDSVDAPSPAIAALVVEGLNEPDIRRLHDRIDNHRADVCDIFERVIRSLA